MKINTLSKLYAVLAEIFCNVFELNDGKKASIEDAIRYAFEVRNSESGEDESVWLQAVRKMNKELVLTPVMKQAIQDLAFLISIYKRAGKISLEATLDPGEEVIFAIICNTNMLHMKASETFRVCSEDILMLSITNNRSGEDDISFSCSGKSYCKLLRVLRSTFCALYGIPREQWEDVQNVVIQNASAVEAQNGEEMRMADRALRNAKEKLGPTTSEMMEAIEAFSCIVQILSKQKDIGVEAMVKDSVAIIKVTCDTTKLHPRGNCLKVLNKNTLQITLKKAA